MGTSLTGRALALAVLMLQGCASLDEGQCRTASWSELGYRDGSNGVARNRMDDYRTDCGKHSVTPDEQAYFTARAKGLLSYCTAGKGLAEGKAGRSYNDVCPPELAGAFVKNHKFGREIYQTRLQMESKRNEIDKREKRLRDAASDEERRTLRNEIRDLDQDVRRLRQSLDALESLGVR